MHQIIEEHWMTLGAVAEEALDPILESIAQNYDLSVASLKTAWTQKKDIDARMGEYTEAMSRSEEYDALCTNTEEDTLAGMVPQFCNEVSDPPDELSPWFDRVGAVTRLREVRALTAFSRIQPYPVSGENVSAAIMDGSVSPLSKARRNWLPAMELRGEGIFLRFREEAIEAWISANPGVVARATALDERAGDVALSRGYTREYSITPRLLLIHSFAHALIRQLSIDCGYSSSALRERLYIGDPETDGAAMSGVLIYTGSPDSEGSLGGLVRMADPELLLDAVRRAVHSSRWCGSDPVCVETDPGQSGERISGAACHCCLLIPETACEKFNRELDRTMLVGYPGLEGSVEVPYNGFFDELLAGGV